MYADGRRGLISLLHHHNQVLCKSSASSSSSSSSTLYESSVRSLPYSAQLNSMCNNNNNNNNRYYYYCCYKWNLQSTYFNCAWCDTNRYLYSSLYTINSSNICTRKLCYRKDDRAMRPIGLHGCPEKFWESLTTPTATTPNIFHGLFSDRLYECSYKIWSP